MQPGTRMRPYGALIILAWILVAYQIGAALGVFA